MCWLVQFLGGLCTEVCQLPTGLQLPALHCGAEVECALGVRADNIMHLLVNPLKCVLSRSDASGVVILHGKKGELVKKLRNLRRGVGSRPFNSWSTAPVVVRDSISPLLLFFGETWGVSRSTASLGNGNKFARS